MSDQTEIHLTRIFEFVKAHPGATPADIRGSIPNADRRDLVILKQRGVIENRGPKVAGRGPGQWHVVEETTQSLYLQRKLEARLEIESQLHRKLFEVLDAHPHVMEQKRLRDYLDFFFNPGEVIYQETVIVADEDDADEDLAGTGTMAFGAEGKAEVVIEENGYLMRVAVPDEREDVGGMWVEVHSVESSNSFDNHDKFKRMLGRSIRVTVEILDKPKY